VVEKPIEFRAQVGKQRMFLASEADIAIYGGSRGGGKTYALLLEPLRHVRSKLFAAVVFRRTYPQVMQEGGLWDTSAKIYPYAGATGSRGTMRWDFPSGATVTFHHMANEDNRHNWLGAQVPLICFDQLETFTQKQFDAMLACNRDSNGIVTPYIRATCNPEPDCWLSRFISWWWDQDTGYAIEERAGVLRWVVRVGDSLEWSESFEELQRAHPMLRPKSVTFIPANVEDNKALLESDPNYLSNLMALPLVERERYLHGNWKIKASSGTMFRREWFITTDERPARAQFCRFWDMAATPDTTNKNADWTCGALVGLVDGVWHICHMIRFRGTPKTNEDTIRQTAKIDPTGTLIRMEEEGGASGKSVVDHYARNVLTGLDFRGVRPRSDKVTRAGPFSSAAQNGNVRLVSGTWNSDLLDELEVFPEGSHDDQVDAVTGAMSCLIQARGGIAIASRGFYDIGRGQMVSAVRSGRALV